MQERFPYLLKKKLMNELTDSEAAEFSALLEAYPDLLELYNTLFRQMPEVSEQRETAAQQAYAAHYVQLQLNGAFQPTQASPEPNTEVPVRKIPAWKAMAWAASIILVVLSGVWMYRQQAAPVTGSGKPNEVVTKKGSKTQVTLPDGTRLWLNADSRITYDENFREATREVTLSGEAFFEVAKDKSRPFIIHTPTIDIKVLGTEFNVRSYPKESTTETSLLHGSIEVTLNRQPANKIVLKPNEKLTVLNNNQQSEPERKGSLKKGDNIRNSTELPLVAISRLHFLDDDSLPAESLWMENKLAFDNESFEKVASKLERWYNVEVETKNAALKEKHFTGVFENNTLAEVMEALRYSVGIRYEINQNKVIIR